MKITYISFLVCSHEILKIDQIWPLKGKIPQFLFKKFLNNKT